MPLAAGDPVRYASLAATLAMLSAAVCLLAGWPGWASWPTCCPSRCWSATWPASRCIMIVEPARQDHRCAGRGRRVRAEVGSFVEQPRPGALADGGAVGGVVVLLFLLAGLATPRCPGRSIVVVLAAAGGGVVLPAGPRHRGGGPVPAGLPTPRCPTRRWADMPMLLLPAIGVAFVGIHRQRPDRRAFALRHGQPVDANQEWTALGAANIASALLPGFPGQLQRQPDRAGRRGRQPEPAVLPGGTRAGAADSDGRPVRCSRVSRRPRWAPW